MTRSYQHNNQLLSPLPRWPSGRYQDSKVKGSKGFEARSCTNRVFYSKNKRVQGKRGLVNSARIGISWLAVDGVGIGKSSPSKHVL